MRVKLEGFALSQPYKKTTMKEEIKGTVKIIIGFISSFIDLFSKPLLVPGKWSLVGCCLWGRRELDTTEVM